MADEFREWLCGQIAACEKRATSDATKRSREYHGQTRWLLAGILAEYDRRRPQSIEEWDKANGFPPALTGPNGHGLTQ